MRGVVMKDYEPKVNRQCTLALVGVIGDSSLLCVEYIVPTLERIDVGFEKGTYNSEAIRAFLNNDPKGGRKQLR